ncbi:MAG: hypothetical protein ACKVS6_04135 [Planctomycetota bacterium]
MQTRVIAVDPDKKIVILQKGILVRSGSVKRIERGIKVTWNRFAAREECVILDAARAVRTNLKIERAEGNILIARLEFGAMPAPGEIVE